MIVIKIYSNDLEQKKDIKKLFEQYFENQDIKVDISYIRTKSLAFDIITAKYMVPNIVIICDGNDIRYVKRSGTVYKNLHQLDVGWFKGTLDNEKIEEIIYNDDSKRCPNGIYKMYTKKVIRAIDYENIEYFKWENNKTTIYLTDNEFEIKSESVKSIKKKLPEEFFIDCIKGHIVNLYNIKKIDRSNYIITMKSGNKITFGKKNLKSITRLYFKIIFDI